MSAESWESIPKFPAYEASNRGHIRRQRTKRRLTLFTDYFGRVRVNLSHRGKTYRRLVHRLVMAAFVGPCPKGQEVCHLDGDPTNNYLHNLCYETHANNQAQRGPNTVKHWTHFDPSTVLEIRNKRAIGHSLKRLADEYERTIPCISQISRGEVYTDIGGPLTFGDYRQSSHALVDSAVEYETEAG